MQYMMMAYARITPMNHHMHIQIFIVGPLVASLVVSLFFAVTLSASSRIPRTVSGGMHEYTPIVDGDVHPHPHSHALTHTRTQMNGITMVEGGSPILYRQPLSPSRLQIKQKARHHVTITPPPGNQGLTAFVTPMTPRSV
jgi:hypothetical protein